MSDEVLSNFVFTILYFSVVLLVLTASWNSMSYQNEFWKTLVWNKQAYLKLDLKYDGYK